MPVKLKLDLNRIPELAFLARATGLEKLGYLDSLVVYILSGICLMKYFDEIEIQGSKIFDDSPIISQMVEMYPNHNPQ